MEILAFADGVSRNVISRSLQCRSCLAECGGKGLRILFLHGCKSCFLFRDSCLGAIWTKSFKHRNDNVQDIPSEYFPHIPKRSGPQRFQPSLVRTEYGCDNALTAKHCLNRNCQFCLLWNCGVWLDQLGECCSTGHRRGEMVRKPTARVCGVNGWQNPLRKGEGMAPAGPSNGVGCDFLCAPTSSICSAALTIRTTSA